MIIVGAVGEGVGISEVVVIACFEVNVAGGVVGSVVGISG